MRSPACASDTLLEVCPDACASVRELHSREGVWYRAAPLQPPAGREWSKVVSDIQFSWLHRYQAMHTLCMDLENSRYRKGSLPKIFPQSSPEVVLPAVSVPPAKIQYSVSPRNDKNQRSLHGYMR